MVIRYMDILELMTVLSDEKGLQCTISQSMKGGLIVGGIATLGGLIFGPPGLAIGGTIGGCIASYITADRFSPVSQVIMEMRENDQRRLVTAVQNIVNNLDVGDALELIALIQGNQLLKARVMTEMVTFLRSQMNYNIPNGDF